MKTRTTGDKDEMAVRKRYVARLCRKATRSVKRLANDIAAVAVSASPEQMSEECARMLADIIGVRLKPGEKNDYKLFMKSLELLFGHIEDAIEDKVLATLASVRYIEAEERRKAKKKGR